MRAFQDDISYTSNVIMTCVVPRRRADVKILRRDLSYLGLHSDGLT